MKKFWKKKIDVPPELLEDAAELPAFPVGAPLIAGGDKVYSVYQAVSVALTVYDNWSKVFPTRAKALRPLVSGWIALRDELAVYAAACDSDFVN